MAPSEAFIELNNMSLFVQRIEQFENAPTIIFLHDSLGCVRLWRDFPAKLCNSVRCNLVMYDRQGYGKSSTLLNHHRSNNYLEIEAEILSHIIAKLKLQNVILFGHSDGGSIALIAAAKYPRLVGGVIVEAAHVFVEQLTLDGIRAMANAYETTDLRNRLEKYHGDKTETIFKAWTETWLGSDFRGWNIEYFLSGIHCPLLFIQGDQDEYGTTAQLQAVARQVSGIVVTSLIPAVHHTPHRQVESEVISCATAFIKSNALTSFKARINTGGKESG